MSKYIDANKLKAEIERQQRKLIVLLTSTKQASIRRDCAFQNGVYSSILSIIDSLHQEQLSLPDNIDEIAQKLEDYYDVGDEHGYLYCCRGDIKDAFKVGAE